MKTTIQIFYDNGLFDNYNYGNADKVLKDFANAEVNERRRAGLDEVKDVIQ